MAAVPRLVTRSPAFPRRRSRRRRSCAWAWEGGEAFDSSPAIVDGVVYVGTATGELIAVGLADGKLRWRYKAGEAIGESSPAVANGRVFIGDLIGVVHAVNVADGKPIWTFKTQSEIKSSPVVVGDVVLMGSYDGKLYGLDAADRQAAVGVHDRELRARHAVRRRTASRTSPAATKCFTPSTSRPARSGSRRRRPRTPARRSRSSTTSPTSARSTTRCSRSICSRARCCGATSIPIASFRSIRRRRSIDGTVVLGGRDRMVHALDAKTGKARWTYMTRARIDSSPAIAGGRVYVGSNDGRFYALDLASGKVVWQHDEGAALTASPALANGRIVIGSTEGRLLCFAEV